MTTSLAVDITSLGLPPALGALLGDSISSAITAGAGGGATNATQLTSTINVVTVVATADDSVKLPLISTWQNKQCIFVRNADASDSLNVFPGTGNSIDGGTATTGQVAIAAGRARLFFRVSNTGWVSLYGS